MVTAEEALKSDDPKIVKRLRGSIGAQISCDIDLLDKELSKKSNQSFEVERISHQLIKVQRKKLLDHFDLIQKLHEQYVVIREEGENSEAENALELADIDYMQKITVKVCSVLDNLTLYDEAMSAASTLKGLVKNNDETRNNCIKAKKDFTIVYDKIISEIDKIELLEDKSEAKITMIKTFPTEVLLHNVHTAFGEVKKYCTKLQDSSKITELGDVEGKAMLSYDEEYAKQLDIEIKLKMYEQIKLPPGLPAAEETTGGVKAMPLKITKPDNISFSGQARDFATFKRDFLAIVVPHREASQIGIYLKQAIPEKCKHLI